MGVPDSVLAAGWNQPTPIPTTQEYGGRWITANSSAVLIVPSAVMPLERNYVLNVLNAAFRKITFGQSEPFPFDPRLK
jgi:RES domain-containing protein